jgi:hypothetical protein
MSKDPHMKLTCEDSCASLRHTRGFSASRFLCLSLYDDLHVLKPLVAFYASDERTVEVGAPLEMIGGEETKHGPKITDVVNTSRNNMPFSNNENEDTKPAVSLHNRIKVALVQLDVSVFQ